MKKNIWITAALLLVILLPLTPAPNQNQESLAEYYDRMSEILFRYDPGIDYPALHEKYRQSRPVQPFIHELKFSIRPKIHDIRTGLDENSPIAHVLIISEYKLYWNTDARIKIDRYVQDIQRAYGCTVTLETVQGGDAETLKKLIQDYYNAGLDGVVLIGRLPAAWYEIENDHEAIEQGGYGYADWTCDLFLMDMDGLWLDTDNNGLYDSHTAGSGDIASGFGLRIRAVEGY